MGRGGIWEGVHHPLGPLNTHAMIRTGKVIKNPYCTPKRLACHHKIFNGWLATSSQARGGGIHMRSTTVNLRAAP